MRFVQSLSTECDHTVGVRIRSNTGNPLRLVAHDIRINGTKVTRISPVSDLSYPQEVGTFRLDRQGQIR